MLELQVAAVEPAIVLVLQAAAVEPAIVQVLQVVAVEPAIFHQEVEQEAAVAPGLGVVEEHLLEAVTASATAAFLPEARAAASEVVPVVGAAAEPDPAAVVDHRACRVAVAVFQEVVEAAAAACVEAAADGGK